MNVVAHELEPRMSEQLFDICFGPGEQVVDTQDIVTLRDEPIDQVRAEKASAPGYEHAACGEIRVWHGVSR